MNSQNVLIIADREDMEFLDSRRGGSDQWNLIWKVTDYSKLHKEVEEIRDLIVRHNIDFVLCSRNDQVAKKIRIGPVTKKLEIGYSSFSGIDDQYRKEQTITCFNDFLKTNVDFNFRIPEQDRAIDFAAPEKAGAGSFSLIFDTEQLGGVRFGLPRILEILQKYNVKSTFFITNLMKNIYPNILAEISFRGHEIGIHGWHHEYLSNLNTEEQRKSIEGMRSDFDYPITGANFIGRMDGNTVRVLIANGVEYFVQPLINDYKLFSYPKLPTNPFLISYENGEILMIPISVETYGRPWFSIKNMIDSAILVWEGFNPSHTEVNNHITILMHPFRDGNTQHIAVTEELLRHLVITKRFKPLLLKDNFHTAQRYRDQEVAPTRFIPDLPFNSGLRPGSRLLPRTKQDYIGILPENLMQIYRRIRKKNTLW